MFNNFLLNSDGANVDTGTEANASVGLSPIILHNSLL